MEIKKTLEAYLAPPTRHKQRKLEDLWGTYQEAFQNVWNEDAFSMSEANDVVTPYDLPYQAKDALKSHARTLRTADNVQDGQPIRLVNRAARFDTDPQRHHAVAWNVPQPGHGTNFWIPIKVNPEHEDHWTRLLDEDDTAVTAGELRLLQRGDQWVLHVTVTLTVPEPSPDSSPTVIGVDVGESQLAVACSLDPDGHPHAPELWNGKPVKALRQRTFTALRRFQSNDADKRREAWFHRFQRQLTDAIEKVSRGVVRYAQRFDDPVIVLEDLDGLRDAVNYGREMNRRLHAWAFNRLQTRIKDKAREAGIPVRSVDPAYTSQQCHQCNHVGTRPHQGTFRCPNPTCHVTEFQADINAAANIAQRAAHPRGETCRLDPGMDDSAGDGRPRDRATAPAAQRRTPLS